MAETDELVLEIEKQSIRGRACPRCGGKIIPSNRAVYQSTGVPSSDVFPLWQCERCGYAQLSAKVEEAPKHGKAAPARKEIAASNAPAATTSTSAAEHLRDAKGRPLPRDVQMVLQRMPKQQQNS